MIEMSIVYISVLIYYSSLCAINYCVCCHVALLG